MKGLVLKMSVTIDGFVGGADGGIRWVFDDDQEAIAWTSRPGYGTPACISWASSTHSSDMAAYWPTSTEVFAPPMNQIPKAVFTRKGSVALKEANTTAALLAGTLARDAAPDQRAQRQKGAESWAEAYVAKRRSDDGDCETEGRERVGQSSRTAARVRAQPRSAGPHRSIPAVGPSGCARLAKVCRSSPDLEAPRLLQADPLNCLPRRVRRADLSGPPKR